MTDYATLVLALYQHYKTWRKVAEVCGGSAEKCGVYWDIAHGRIKHPNRTVKMGILNAINSLPSNVVKTTRPPRDLQRRNIKIPIDLFKRMKVVKNTFGETWQEYQEKALQARLEKE